MSAVLSARTPGTPGTSRTLAGCERSFAAVRRRTASSAKHRKLATRNSRSMVGPHFGAKSAENPREWPRNETATLLSSGGQVWPSARARRAERGRRARRGRGRRGSVLDGEAVLAHPVVVVELRDIGLPAVGEDGDDHLPLAQLLGELHRHGHGAARGAAGEDALLASEPPRPGEAGLVVD